MARFDQSRPTQRDATKFAFSQFEFPSLHVVHHFVFPYIPTSSPHTVLEMDPRRSGSLESPQDDHIRASHEFGD